jgi:autotransporter-associated beta strand protein
MPSPTSLPQTSTFRLASFALIAACAGVVSPAQGGDVVWKTASGFGVAYGTGSNWSTNNVPAAGDSAIFGPNTTGTTTVSVASDQPSSSTSLAAVIFRDVSLINTGTAITVSASSTGTSTQLLRTDAITVDGTVFSTTANVLKARVQAGVNGFTLTNNAAVGISTLDIQLQTSASYALDGPGALTYDGVGQTLISGAVTNFSSGLIKNGSGTLILGAANSGFGSAADGIKLNAGNLILNNSAAGGTTAGITFTSSSTAALGTTNSSTIGRAITLTGSGRFFGSPGLTGSASGAGDFIKLGTNQPQIQSNFAHTGATVVEAGNLQVTTLLGNDGRLSGTSAIRVLSGVSGSPGKLQVTNTSTNLGDRVRDAAPILLAGGTLQYQGSVTSAANSETFGTLEVRGYGQIQTASSAAAGTDLTFGALTRADAFTTIDVPNAVSDTLGTAATRVTFPLSTTFVATGGSGKTTEFTPYFSNGGFLMTIGSVSGGTRGVLQGVANTNTTYFNQASASLTGGENNNVTASFAVGSDVSVKALANNSFGISLTGSGVVTVASGIVANNGSLTLNGPQIAFGATTGFIHTGSGVTVTGTSKISGAAGVVVSGASSSGLTISNSVANDFTGGLYVNGLAGVSFTNDNQLGAAGERVYLRGGGISYSGSTAASLATSGADRPVTIGQADAAAGTMVGRIGVSSSSGTLTVNAVVTGTGSLVKEGSGALVLGNAANDYQGGTQIVGGRLNVSADGQLGAVPDTAAENVWMGGNALGATESFTLNAKRTVVLGARQNNSSGSGTFDVASGKRFVVAGAVINPTLATSGSSLTKSGAGTLVLGGDVTYSGTTSVNAGTLTVNTTMSPGGAVTVSGSGSTLAGKGTIKRPITISSSASLAPGDAGIGTLTTNATVTFSTFSSNSFSLEFDASSSDKLVTTGSVSLGTSGQPTLTLLPLAGSGAFNVPGGVTFTFIDTPGSTSLTGAFSNFANGTPVYDLVNGYTYVVNYTNGDVLLTVTPEPACLSLLGLAVAGLTGRPSRRRRVA